MKVLVAPVGREKKRVGELEIGDAFLVASEDLRGICLGESQVSGDSCQVHCMVWRRLDCDGDIGSGMSLEYFDDTEWVVPIEAELKFSH